VDIFLLANGTAPPILGLVFDSSFRNADLVSSYAYFFMYPGVNQVMFFIRFLSPPRSAAQISSTINSDVMNSNLNADAGLPNIFWGRYLLYSNLSCLRHTISFSCHESSPGSSISITPEKGSPVTPQHKARIKYTMEFVYTGEKHYHSFLGLGGTVA
jgi:hypothetical protein